MKRKSPQQKKRESYLRDRRNVYGESTQASRRNIPRNKRYPKRSNRRAASTALATLRGGADLETAEGVELRLLGKRQKAWRKTPDAPLGEFVEQRLRRRVALGLDQPSSAEKKIRRIRRSSVRQ